MRVAITGAAGFVGSHLVDRYLADGATVIGLDDLSTGRLENLKPALESDRFRFLFCNVSQGYDIVGRMLGDGLPIDVVHHLASPASPVDYVRLPLQTLRANSVGTEAMLEIARRFDADFLFASGSEVYGDPLDSPQREDHRGNVSPNGERSCYEESKRYGEALVAAYVRQFGLRARVARIFNTYGQRLRPADGRVVPNFIAAARAKCPLTINGDGLQTRSFCYIDDLIEGIVLLARKRSAAGRTVNLGNPEEITVRGLAALVCELAGVPAAFESRPLPSDDPARSRPDISVASDLLGWRPRVGLRAGLQRTLETWPAKVAAA
jgi:nucleoside-diphosphate-sugar epimerase